MSLVNPGGDIQYSTNDAPISNGVDFVDITIDGSFLPEVERTYKALTFDWERPFDGKWAFRGNYTWSDTEGNYEGSVKSDNGQTDAGITTDFDQPGFTDGSFGKLPNHRAHQLKLWGTYAITERLTAGANYSMTSPRKFGCTGVHPTDDFAALYDGNAWYCLPSDFDSFTDPTGNGFVYQQNTTFGVNSGTDLLLPASTQTLEAVASLTPRGSQLESDWIHTLNLQLAYQPEFANDHMTLRVDVFNVFNSQGVTDIDETGMQGGSFLPIYVDPNYGAPRSYQAPRSVRLGMSLDF